MDQVLTSFLPSIRSQPLVRIAVPGPDQVSGRRRRAPNTGALSMDDEGNPTAVGGLEQQMKNAYADLEKVLKHYGYTFDDVVVKSVFTTDMARFLEVASFRNSIYTKHFPTGSWLEVKVLALPEFMIEIELEALK